VPHNATMSREATAKLAKAAWIVPLLYVFANRFVGTVIGRVFADALVFVLAVLAIPVAVFCLIQIRAHGARGILGHAIGALVVSALLLAIWIPNYLAARERARVAEAQPAVTVHVTRDGTIRMNGAVVTLDTLTRELQRVAATGGSMRYSRDDPSADPHPNAMAVMKAAVDSKIAIQMAVPE
jgi:hypothetical protein